MVEKVLENLNLYPILPHVGGDLEQVILHCSSLILLICKQASKYLHCGVCVKG